MKGFGKVAMVSRDWVTALSWGPAMGVQFPLHADVLQ